MNSEAVSFDTQIFDFEGFHSEIGNWKIAAQKRNLNLREDLIIDNFVFVAYMNFGSDSAIEVFDNLVEVH